MTDIITIRDAETLDKAAEGSLALEKALWKSHPHILRTLTGKEMMEVRR